MLEDQTNGCWEFMKGFSSLGALQKHATITYSCKKQGLQEYCFCLKRECEGAVDEESMVVHHLKEHQALCLIQFLYENAVPLENWRDVVKELEQRV